MEVILEKKTLACSYDMYRRVVVHTRKTEKKKLTRSMSHLHSKT